MKKNKISVIMSAYNEPPLWIKQSVESILKQTYKNFEFIIILDNPENSELKMLLEEYQKQDSRVRFFMNSNNVGLVESLNRALTYTTGEFVARMDADDISYCERLKLQYTHLRERGVDFVTSSVDFLDENNQLNKNTFDKSYDWKQLAIIEGHGNVSAHPTWMMKKEVYDVLNGYRSVNFCEDYDFILRAIQHGFKCERMSNHVLQYRTRLSGISRSKTLEQFLKMRFLRSKYREKVDLDSITEELCNNIYNEVSNKQQAKFSQAISVFWEGKTHIKNRQYISAGVKIIKAIFWSDYFRQYFWDNISWMLYVKLK